MRMRYCEVCLTLFDARGTRRTVCSEDCAEFLKRGEKATRTPPKRRQCLRCGVDFPSAGPANRLCPRCAKRVNSPDLDTNEPVRHRVLAAHGFNGRDLEDEPCR